MTGNELASRLTRALKRYITDKDYIDTGRLLASVDFTVTENPFDIQLDSEDYIIYLEQGRLLENFFNTTDVENILDDYFGSKLDELGDLI